MWRVGVCLLHNPLWYPQCARARAARGAARGAAGVGGGGVGGGEGGGPLSLLNGCMIVYNRFVTAKPTPSKWSYSLRG